MFSFYQVMQYESGKVSLRLWFLVTKRPGSGWVGHRFPGPVGSGWRMGASSFRPRFLPEKGATVSWQYRKPEEELQSGERQARDPLDGRSHTAVGNRVVLIVEDEPAVRTLARRMLERSGFHVLTAADGAEALVILDREGEKVQVVVSDLEMPRMGGLELFECLRGRGMRVPFILASGYQSVSGLHEVSERWKEDLAQLQKPWTRADILEAVNAAFT